MKKYVFLLLGVCLLLKQVSPVLASETTTLQLDSHQQLTTTIESNQQVVKIVNPLAYDLQICALTISEADQLIFTFDDQQNLTFEELKAKIFTQIILSNQSIEFSFQSKNDTHQQITISLEWLSIMVSGYVYIDHHGQGEPKSQVKIDLWEENNLIDTTYTDEKGYYQFKRYNTQQYWLKIPDLDQYTLQHTPSQQKSAYAFTSQEFSEHYDFLLTPLTYHLYYDTNGGEITSPIPQKSYSFNDSISVTSFPILKRDGYSFKEWNEAKDGSGISYQNNDILIMPAHDVTLYAIWEKTDYSSAKRSSQSTKSLNPKKQKEHVKTSDDTSITIIALLFLASLSILIVLKVLKKKENK